MNIGECLTNMAPAHLTLTIEELEVYRVMMEMGLTMHVDSMVSHQAVESGSNDHVQYRESDH